MERFISSALLLPMLGILTLQGAVIKARAQTRPYIGFVYPAGGQHGTTFQVKLGGQGLDNITGIVVTGKGVSARVVECYRRIGPQEITLLNEQLRELKKGKSMVAMNMMSSDAAMMSSGNAMMSSDTMMAGKAAPVKKVPGAPVLDEATKTLIAKIDKRIEEYCNRPASVALAGLVFLEVNIAPDAEPGERELRIQTLMGVSNPMVFHVGQLPEHSRKPMLTSDYQVLGKENLALRKRPTNEVECCVTVPCTVNGQIANGEVNRYRFQARKGQRLVLTTQARQLIPYIADAVPGWFQPVLALYDTNGKEVAYDDDFRFKPDPTIMYLVPNDGEYIFTITDAIYRGREDFVYRVTIGELPFVTSIFPLGGPVGQPVKVKVKGSNLDVMEWPVPAAETEPGIFSFALGKGEFISNRVPFARDTLPECFDKEPNDTLKKAQKVALPIIINGRMDRSDDWDVFQFTGRAGEVMAVEVYARRLDSPLDSVIKLTDSTGKLLAVNDDREDLGSGINTHHADSYLMVKLPADGTYFVHLGDTARNSGDEYAYRLRISLARPDFALRVVPSSVSFRSKAPTTVSVFAIRKDGYTGPIKLDLIKPPKGISASPISITGTQEVARLFIKNDLVATEQPFRLSIIGTAKIQERDVVHEAVPAEDRMQAFLWRHLVPASEFTALVYNPSYQPPPKRVPPVHPPSIVEVKPTVASTNSAATKPKFSKQQVAGRLRELKLLYEEGLLTDEFNAQKVAECEASR